MRQNDKTVTVFLSDEDYGRLAAICEERGQTRADFLRDCIEAAGAIPKQHRRKVTGIALARHEARLEREKQAGRKSKRKG